MTMRSMHVRLLDTCGPRDLGHFVCACSYIRTYLSCADTCNVWHLYTRLPKRTHLITWPSSSHAMIRIFHRASKVSLLAARCHSFLLPLARRYSLVHSLISAPQVSYLVADSLIPKCISCGITLQKKQPEAPGYYVNPTSTQHSKLHKPEDAIYENAYAKLSEEDKALLLNGSTAPIAPKPQPTRAPPRGHTCIRCRNAHYKSVFDPSQHEVDSVASVMDLLPPAASMVYVISAADFPMSLNSQVFRFKTAQTMYFVITKSDLFFARNSTASKNGLQFFQDYLHNKYNVPAERVHLVSGQVDWNTEQLYEALPNHSFFIGAVNSGKLTLLQLLVYVGQKEQERLPNARRQRTREKEDNLAQGISHRKHLAAEIRRLKTHRGPGVSYMPGFTRGIMAVELTKKKVMYDVPGFDVGSSTSHRLIDILLPSAIKQLNKGRKFHKYGTYSAHYETARAGQVITVGGTFFMQVPEGCMYRVRNLINHKVHIFNNMDKALEVWQDAKDKRAVEGIFLVDSNRAKLVKFQVPEFHGSFDLVLQSMGYVNITATGALPVDPKPLYVYLPEGIEAVWRDPIAKYVAKSLSGKDKFGNSLAKEKWVRLSTKVLKRIQKDNTLTKELIRVEE